MVRIYLIYLPGVPPHDSDPHQHDERAREVPGVGGKSVESRAPRQGHGDEDASVHRKRATELRRARVGEQAGGDEAVACEQEHPGDDPPPAVFRMEGEGGKEGQWDRYNLFNRSTQFYLPAKGLFVFSLFFGSVRPTSLSVVDDHHCCAWTLA